MVFDNLEQIIAPKSIDDIVFASTTTRELIDDLITGTRPFPVTEGKCGILLYGISGTGKSALAKLLPDAIEQARGGISAGERYERVQPSNNGLKMMANVAHEAELMPLGHYRYFVLDEVDCLNTDAMRILKSVMNYPNTLWVFTTNNFSAIEAGVRDRCHCIPFNAAPAANWLPLARRILAVAGITSIPDQQLDDLIAPCNGSARQIVSAIVDVALKARRRPVLPSETVTAS
jgi:replication-associated recombination protein RarA